MSLVKVGDDNDICRLPGKCIFSWCFIANSEITAFHACNDFFMEKNTTQHPEVTEFYLFIISYKRILY